ncbi:MAG: hypothetical protein R3F34_08855 [Planctomycetota bacterium]
MLVGALGGAELYVAVTTEDWILDVDPLTVGPIVASGACRFLATKASGPVGEPGVGRWSYAIEYVPGLVGRTLHAQAFLEDRGAPGGLARSNRIAVTYGR